MASDTPLFTIDDRYFKFRKIYENGGTEEMDSIVNFPKVFPYFQTVYFTTVVDAFDSSTIDVVDLSGSKSIIDTNTSLPITFGESRLADVDFFVTRDSI